MERCHYLPVSLSLCLSVSLQIIFSSCVFYLISVLSVRWFPKYLGVHSSVWMFIICKCPEPHIFIFCRPESGNKTINSVACCGCATICNLTYLLIYLFWDFWFHCYLLQFKGVFCVSFSILFSPPKLKFYFPRCRSPFMSFTFHQLFHNPKEPNNTPTLHKSKILMGVNYYSFFEVILLCSWFLT